MNISKSSFLFYLLLLFSCQPGFLGDPSGNAEGDAQTTLNIHLTDGPTDLEEVNIDLQLIRIKGPDGFEEISLETNAGIYNLLDYQNGIDVLIASADLQITQIREVRLVLGENNSVVADGETFDLKIPSGDKTGLKIKVCLDLTGMPQYDLILDFDAAASVHMTENGKYIMKPVIKVVNPDAQCKDSDDDDDDGKDDNDDQEENEDEKEDDGEGDISLEDLPQDIKDYLDENYSDYKFNIKAETFCDGTEVYFLEGTNDENKVQLYYDLDWNLVQTAIPTDTDNLPENFSEVLATDYPDYKLMDSKAWEIERADSDVWYRLYLKKDNSNEKIYVIYNADGTFVCQEE